MGYGHPLHHVMGSNNLNSLSVARMYKLRPFGPIIPIVSYILYEYMYNLYMDCTQYYIYTVVRVEYIN